MPVKFNVGGGGIDLGDLGGDSVAAYPSQVYPGKSFFGAGSENVQYGTMPVQNAETDGDRAWATAIACWEGQANFGVRNGHYFNGVNHIRGNIPNFFAANIKKGVNMGGLVGTFEGYVPNPKDLYLRGTFNVSFFDLTDYVDSWVMFDSGQITFYGIYKGPILKFTTDFKGFNSFNIELNITNSNVSLSKISLTKNKRLDILVSRSNIGIGSQVVSLDIRAVQMNTTFYLVLDDLVGAIYRIWLS